MVSVSSTFARDRADSAPVTVRQLLASSPLGAEGQLVAGADGLDSVVTDVVVGTIHGASAPLSTEPGALAVLAGGDLRADTYQVDMAIRGASESRSAGIVLCTDRTNIVLAATRLANKLKVPVIISETADPIVLSDALRRIVLAPQVGRSETLLAVISLLARLSPTTSTEEALSRLGSLLAVDLALANAEGTLVAGAEAASPTNRGDLLDVPTTTVAPPYTLRAQPLRLARREGPSFWLLARLLEPTAARLSIVEDALTLISWFLGARLVGDRLERERDARFRIGVLNAILSGQEGFDAGLLHNLGILGWNVDGWCTAFYLQASGEADALRVLTLTDQLSRALADQGVTGPLVERPDGWTGWMVSRQEPQASSYRDTAATLTSVSESFLAFAPQLRLHVGIGRPYLGLDGLRTSLSEAKEAATIAQAAGGSSSVQHIDEMGVRRILLGWYASDSFADFAQTLLGPLLVSDGDGTLLHTLEVYLDEESSATMAAARLKVHRNTILNRIDRLKTLLTVDLDDPEERLAVQLACRVIRLKRGEPPPTG